MGPNDPFETTEARRSFPDGEGFAFFESLSDAGMPHGSTTKRWAPLIGLFLGVLFGILMLTYSFTGALLIYLLGGLGAFLGWLGHSLATGRFDLAAAWRALRRNDSGRG